MAEQMGLFPGEDALQGPDLDVLLRRSVFDDQQALRLFDILIEETPWQQDYITMYGKQTPIPRRTAWFGETTAPYTYSGITMAAYDWNEPDSKAAAAILEIRRTIEPIAETTFNSLLLNRYDSGKDGVAWHADDEKELGPNPTIGSVTFGATRKFQLRRRDDSAIKQEVELHSGDLLVMRGATQQEWLHQVPKTSREVGVRINLTFRTIAQSSK